MFCETSNLYNQGQHREAAAQLILLYNESYGSKFQLRYYVLVLYSNLVLLTKQVTAEDVKAIKEIEKDERQPLLERIWAAFVHGHFIRHRYRDFDGCTVKFTKMIDMCDKAVSDPVYMRSTVVAKHNLEGSDTFYSVATTTIRHMISQARSTAMENLVELQRPFKFATSPDVKGDLVYMDSFATESEDAPWTRRVKDLLDMPISSLAICARCQSSRFVVGGTDGNGNPINITENEGLRLKRCAKCVRVAYCSAKCQKDDWNMGGHKDSCRQAGDFRRHDIIMLKGLEGKAVMNGLVGVVLEKVPVREDGIARYGAFMFGPELSKASIIVKAHNMTLKILRETYIHELPDEQK
ncbi:hypothetical protein HDU76_003964 [Blyttiomyces sp. JEL0837]|nr:hypothetical protein HDU76_003964 [Blyttiomyces sp. JEL0837]